MDPVITGIVIVVMIVCGYIIHNQNKADKENMAKNYAAAKAQYEIDMVVWATSKYNPASPNADFEAIKYAGLQWGLSKNPNFDPSRQGNPNYKPSAP